ncbi:hypothetical protein CEXT_138781 [Caerostris extrusa]|uniref:Uncharacterized protein n=1 Tax=Caerostris extrusa TaxID=172846 RepID=A0AAV4R729_CAEEX|nr:hypothetical protein CEXT_138781 [Caerostris extrusa]
MKRCSLLKSASHCRPKPQNTKAIMFNSNKSRRISTGSNGDTISEAEATGDHYRFYKLNYQRTKKIRLPNSWRTLIKQEQSLADAEGGVTSTALAF